MAPNTRKYDSGYEKRKKRKKMESLIESQKVALDKFIIKESQVTNDNVDVHVENENVNVHVGNENFNVHVQSPIDLENNIDVEHVHDMPIVSNDVNDMPNGNPSVDNVPSDNPTFGNVPGDTPNVDDGPIENDNVDPCEPSYMPDIYDPRVWDGLNSKMIDLLVQNGPKRDYSVVKGPKDKFSRRFTANLYTRVLSNGEKCDRDWLVYSKELDRVFFLLQII